MHANERNNCQHCWRKFVILSLIATLSVPSFSSICLSALSRFFPQIIVALFDTSQRQEISSRRSISCSTSWSDHLLMHLLAFFDFLPKRLMFPQIIRSTQLDTPCLQQSRKKKTHYDYLFFEKNILQGACADVLTRPTLLGFHANGRNIVALRFAGHRTIEMLGLVGPKV